MKWRISCRQASRLASDALLAPLPASDSWALRFHLVVCPPCRRFRRQIGAMERRLREMPLPPLPQARKRAIQRLIEGD